MTLSPLLNITMDNGKAEDSFIVRNLVHFKLVLQEPLVVGSPVILVLLVDHSVHQHILSFKPVAPQSHRTELTENARYIL